MLMTLQIVALLFVAVAMALTLAHALELPGKMRLSKDEYLTVQPIYYPGFTVGGAAEPLSLLLLIALMLVTPPGPSLWLTAGAFATLAAAHATYWVLTSREQFLAQGRRAERTWSELLRRRPVRPHRRCR